jgi:hypothetical protein
MVRWEKLLIDGGILSIIASIYILAILYVNPRLVLQNYREDIQSRAPPKNEQERRISLFIGIPFLMLIAFVPFLSTLDLKHQLGDDVKFIALFIHAFGVGFIFNLIDLLILDWFMFCLITPEFIVIPGTEGMQAYKDYSYHFKKAIIGTIISLLAGIVISVFLWVN